MSGAIARRVRRAARRAGRPAKGALAAALIVSMLAPAGSAFAVDTSLERTNIQMVEEAIRGAIREALETFPPPTADLRLMPLGNSDANPLVESVLVEELAARGYPVEIATPQEVQALLGEVQRVESAAGATAAPGPAAPAAGDPGDAEPGSAETGDSGVPVDSAAVDAGAADTAGATGTEGAATETGESELEAALERPRKAGGLAAQLRAARDSAAALETESVPSDPATSPVISEANNLSVEDLLASRATFSYRVTDFDFRYADIYRPAFVGPKRIRRLAQVELHMRLMEEGGRRVTWSKNVQHSASDVISYGSASHLESTSFAFAKPERSPSFLTRLYEPVIVGAIVGGLVFLFYSNQSGD